MTFTGYWRPLALSIIFVGGLSAQDDTTNYGGSRQFKLSPGQTPIRGLYIQSANSNDSLDMPEIPIDVYELVNLSQGHSYSLTITKVDGYAGFNVIDRLSGKNSSFFNVTTFSETITPAGTTYGPIEVSIAGGATSYISGLQYASTYYQISLLDPNTPTVTIQPVGGIHDGMLIKSVDPNDQTIYLIENGLKRGFPSASHFNSWYFGRWDLVVPVAAFAVNNTPTGPNMPFKDGALVKYSDRPVDATVFVIQQGQRRGFTSWNDFKQFGHSTSDILPVPGSILDFIGLGANLSFTGNSGTPKPQINDVNPKTVPVGNNNTFTIDGTGFQQGFSGALWVSGSSFPLNPGAQTIFISSTRVQLIVQVGQSNSPTTTFGLQIINPGGQASNIFSSGLMAQANGGGGGMAGLQVSFSPSSANRTSVSDCSGGTGYLFTFAFSETQGVGLAPTGLSIDGSTGWTPPNFTNHISAHGSNSFGLEWCRGSGSSTWTVTALDDNGHTVTGSATLTMN